MDLRRLKYFVAVAEELHFGRASEKVHVVQSAVSRQVKLLEEELGFPLFTRARQKVRLTIPGEIFLPEAYAILRRVEEGIERTLASARGAVGRLTIGFVDVAMWTNLPSILREFRTRSPSLDLQLRQMDRLSQIAALEAGTIDLGILPSPAPAGTDVACQSLASASFVAVLPLQHRLAGRPEIRLSDLASEPFVLFPPRMRSRLLEVIVAACSAAGFMPRVTQEAEQLHTLISLVNAGLGVTVAPNWVTKSNLANVTYARISDAMPQYELLMAWRVGATNAAVEKFRLAASAAAPD